MHTTEGTQSKRRNGGARWEHAGMGCALHSPREVRYARTAPMAGIWRGMAAGKRGGAAALAARAVVRGHGPTIPRTSDGRRGPTEPSAMIATSVLNRSTVYSVIVLGRETVYPNRTLTKLYTVIYRTVIQSIPNPPADGAKRRALSAVARRHREPLTRMSAQ